MQTGSCRRNPEVEGPFVHQRPSPSVWQHLLDRLHPVVSWTTVQCIFIMALLLGWHMRSIDFIMAYTQADVKTDIFMQLLAGTTIKEVDPHKHLLKLQKKPVWLEGRPSHLARAHQGRSPRTRIPTIQGRPLSIYQGDHCSCPLCQRCHPVLPKFHSNQP